MQLTNKVFVVTGGGNGIGRQVALGLAKRGAHVAAVDLNETGLAETLQMSAGTRGRVTTHTVDVTDRDAVVALPERIIEVHGGVDGVVNVAGIIHRFAPVVELRTDEIERIINVNLWGTINVCRAFLPFLLKRPAANLTNMSSLSALLPFAGQTVYGTSKAAVKQFSEGLYAELMDTPIEVVTLFPGNISTNLMGNSGVASLDTTGKKVRATTPEEAGRIIIEGIEKGSFRVLVGSDARLLNRLTRLAPRRTTRLIAKQMKSVL